MKIGVINGMSYPNRRFDLVLFDLGATLIYFDASWQEVTTQAMGQILTTLNKIGYHLDGDFLKAYASNLKHYYAQTADGFVEYTHEFILHKLLTELGYPGVPNEHVRTALDAWYGISQTHWHPEEDAVPMLKQLLEEGYRLGMISNAGDAKDVQTLVDNARLRSYFEQIIVSAEAGIRKPNPRIFQMALDFFQVPREKAVMVGDTLGADILGALNAKVANIFITRRADTPDNNAHLDTILPDVSVGMLSEIPHVLAHWEEYARARA
jgi:HAD superfamily hydrolase (TIGR01549 family)